MKYNHQSWCTGGFFVFCFFSHSPPGRPRSYHPLFPRLLKHSIKTLITLIPELFYLQDTKGEAMLSQKSVLFSEELRLPMKERIHINWNKIPCSCCSQQFSLRRKFFFFLLTSYAVSFSPCRAEQSVTKRPMPSITSFPLTAYFLLKST